MQVSLLPPERTECPLLPDRPLQYHGIRRRDEQGRTRRWAWPMHPVERERMRAAAEGLRRYNAASRPVS